MKPTLPLLAMLLVACAPETKRELGAGATPADTAAQEASVKDEPSAPPKVGQLPYGWQLAGMAADEYEATTDAQVVHQGRFSARLRATVDKPRAFGTMSQFFDATRFRGSRIRLRGFVKAEGVANWAGMWMRVDEGGAPVVLDNMQRRPLTGDVDWKEVAIVLDVAEQADQIGFGILLDGPGTVWIDGLVLEKVDLTVPTTGLGSNDEPLPDEPANLTFVE